MGLGDRGGRGFGGWAVRRWVGRLGAGVCAHTWWHRNHPCFSQSSSALRTMPVPLPALGVTITWVGFRGQGSGSEAGLGHRSRAQAPFVGLGGNNHLGSQHAHQPPPLHREGLGHADDALVAPLGTEHRHRDPGVARGGCGGAAACGSVCAHGKGWGSAGVARAGRALARRGESDAVAGVGAAAHPRRPYPRA